MLYYISSFCRRIRTIPLVLSQPSLQRGTFWAAGPKGLAGRALEIPPFQQIQQLPMDQVCWNSSK